MKGVLRNIGRLTPNIKYFRAIPTRILTPVHRALGYGGGIVDVLNFKMKLNPLECVDNSLWFHPHIYDRSERDFILAHVKAGTLLDVGANIGFWSLFLSKNVRNSNILAIEANPSTANILKENIQINEFNNIDVIEVGVGPDKGKFDLYLNTTGNRGGDSFVSDGMRAHKVEVPVERISDLIKDRNIDRIEFMKIDVEGMEEGVFGDIFANLDQRIWPRLVCVETLHSPNIVSMLLEQGYRLALRARENSIFIRDTDANTRPSGVS